MFRIMFAVFFVLGLASSPAMAEPPQGLNKFMGVELGSNISAYPNCGARIKTLCVDFPVEGGALMGNSIDLGFEYKFLLATTKDGSIYNIGINSDVKNADQLERLLLVKFGDPQARDRQLTTWIFRGYVTALERDPIKTNFIHTSEKLYERWLAERNEKLRGIASKM